MNSLSKLLVLLCFGSTALASNKMVKNLFPEVAILFDSFTSPAEVEARIKEMLFEPLPVPMDKQAALIKFMNELENYAVYKKN